ncbi:Anti-sigma regulatory factor (Ser/Thr protein kinase) [Thermomonospora echinospora]|uniref:Anti-sigma regulatory factor (Ser/Thr protein kinase) n=1 Tax=Thermomonospora echinospora TaxID=1992 RepID=A0A1H5XVE1_9ACTN|nr:ATP-binding protein [Thermomonospora echinospora]SEG15749.1 Anti-sigma regulatory factor (Ser/Thr protein kinase) [Thermomonospora echinospora]
MCGIPRRPADPEEIVVIAGRPRDLPLGGACLWALPLDASIAARARQLVGDVLGALAFPREQLDNGRLAVSELATNAFQHARPPAPLRPFGQVAPAELWMWARTYPRRELVVTVFDACRDRVPVARAGGGLDEYGRGLGMVAELCASWGTGPSRSLLQTRPIPGKTVWFTLPLPDPWPGAARLASPSRTAESLHAMLARRGVHGVITRHAKGVSLVSAPCGINVTMEPAAMRYMGTEGTYVRRPLTDLNDLAEHIVRRNETPTIRP